MNITALQPAEISSKVHNHLELTERNMWCDLWQSVPLSQRYDLRLNTECIGGGCALISESLPDWFFNRVIGMGVDTPVEMADVDYLVDRYGKKGLPFAIALSPHARPQGFDNALVERGFKNVLNWAKMFRDTSMPVEIKTDLRVEEIMAEQHQQAASVIIEGFAAPVMLKPLFETSLGLPQNAAYMLWDGDRPVAVGILSVYGTVGYLHTACTIPAYRRRGAQAFLMAHRIREGIKRGCRLFMTETGILPDEPNTSLQNMIRMGFKLAYSRPNYVLQPL